MFPNCIDRLGHQKRETKQQQTNKEKPRKKLKSLRPLCNVTRSSVLVTVGVLYLPLQFIIIAIIIVVVIVLLILLLLLISFLLFQLLLEFLSRAVYCSYEVS